MGTRTIVRFMLLVALVATSSMAGAVSSVVNFQQQSIAQPDVPLLVIVTQDDCEWCEYVIQRHLDPLQRDLRQHSTPDLVIRKLDLMDDIIDYNGERLDGSAFVRRYADSFTPTVLLLGPDGELLTKPLVGVSSRDYYSVYLDRAIGRATKTLAERLAGQ